ncbi:MAG: hypothetical protein IT393_04880 [Nitrospirae bacterium]|nr:hypothetical protein [Nitrospirota bacterium]
MFFLRRAFWLGVGVVVAYEFLPQIMKSLRPVAIQAMKTGLAVADQMKVAGAEGKESFADLMAEARSQYEAEKGTAEAPPAEEVKPKVKRAAKRA